MSLLPPLSLRGLSRLAPRLLVLELARGLLWLDRGRDVWAGLGGCGGFCCSLSFLSE